MGVCVCVCLCVYVPRQVGAGVKVQQLQELGRTLERPVGGLLLAELRPVGSWYRWE